MKTEKEYIGSNIIVAHIPTEDKLVSNGVKCFFCIPFILDKNKVVKVNKEEAEFLLGVDYDMDSELIIKELHYVYDKGLKYDGKYTYNLLEIFLDNLSDTQQRDLDGFIDMYINKIKKDIKHHEEVSR